MRKKTNPLTDYIDLKAHLEEIELIFLTKTLEAYPYSHAEGARHLNLNRTTYIMKLKKYGIYKKVEAL
jgi:transcriptional regulator with PAS, ATPase and Fis domain